MSYKNMMNRAAKKAQAWEHDGTNERGISTFCQTCGRLLVHGECGRCVKLSASTEDAVADELRHLKGDQL